MPGVDMNDMERRRQIALKALNERLSRTTDASRQNILPKSFPHSHHGHGHHGHGHGHHGHGHGHGHNHGHHGQQSGGQPSFIATQKVPMTTFTIPAIPLPPPPSAIQSNIVPSPISGSSSEQTAQNTQTVGNLIDLNAEKPSDTITMQQEQQT